MSDKYYQKYLKYKNKYLFLKNNLKYSNNKNINQKGGLPILSLGGETNYQKYYTNNFDVFQKLINDTDVHNLNMIIGLSYFDRDIVNIVPEKLGRIGEQIAGGNFDEEKNMNDYDHEEENNNLINRSEFTIHRDEIETKRQMQEELETDRLPINVGWTKCYGTGHENATNIEGYMNSTEIEELLQWFQLDTDFNFAIGSESILTPGFRYEYIFGNNDLTTKFANIIWEGSTAKFLLTLDCIGIIYYMFLQVGGFIFLEQNDTRTSVYSNDRELNEIYGGPTNLSTSHDYFQDKVRFNRTETCHGYDKRAIMHHNATVLKNILKHSTIEIFYDRAEEYPLVKGNLERNYPINYYYKITKNPITYESPMEWPNAYLDNFIQTGCQVKPFVCGPSS